MSVTPGNESTPPGCETRETPREANEPAWLDNVEIKFALGKKDVYFDILGIPDHIKSQLIPFDAYQCYTHHETGLKLRLTQTYGPGLGPQFQNGTELWLARFGFFSDQWGVNALKCQKLAAFRAKFSDDQLRAAFKYFGLQLIKTAVDFDAFIEQRSETWRVTSVPKRKRKIVIKESVE